MRLLGPFLLALGLGASAFAQTPPRVTIEDDVAPATALQCAALRMVMSVGGPHDTHSAASFAAWQDYPGVEQAKVFTEAAKLKSATPETFRKMDDACAAFEIRATQ